MIWIFKTRNHSQVKLESADHLAEMCNPVLSYAISLHWFLSVGTWDGRHGWPRDIRIWLKCYHIKCGSYATKGVRTDSRDIDKEHHVTTLIKPCTALRLEQGSTDAVRLLSADREQPAELCSSLRRGFGESFFGNRVTPCMQNIRSMFIIQLRKNVEIPPSKKSQTKYSTFMISSLFTLLQIFNSHVLF